MAKKRIYEVAREYNISSEALVRMLRDLGHEVKSHMSVMDDKMSEDVKRKFEAEKSAAREDYARKKQLAEKPAVAQAPAPAAVPPRPSKRRKRKGHVVTAPAAPTVTAPTVTPPPAAQPASPGPVERDKRRRSKKKRKIDRREIEASVRRTLAQMDVGARIKRRKRRVRETETEGSENGHVIRVSEFISAAELAEHLGVNPSEVVAKCLQLGLLVTINQRLDMDTIMTVASEFGYEVEEQEEYGADLIEEDEAEDDADLIHRPPVVTIMGHVDHGKTSLLDYIRRSNVIAGEAGGITQHIGAYEVALPQGKITFLDTPGHAAFTAMRARGAQVTDIVVLVVAADEQVMPQTIEAIDHARAAGVPIIVALNKIDLPTARPDRLREQLAQHGVLVEGWGGQTLSAEVSAKTGQGVDRLLEMILLQAEVLELKANPTRRATGVVIEAELDRGRGTIATVLIQQGLLRVGEPFVAGLYSGRVRALLNERGSRVEHAGPSTPTQITGFSGMPQVGDTFFVVESEQIAREISLKRQQLRREHDYRQVKRLTLEDIYHQIKEGQIRELPLIIKADVGGSVEALSDALQRLGTDEVKIRIIHQGIGGITESDVLLAAASNAIIIGFHVRPDGRVRELAAREKVDVRLYDIIYRVINDVTAALEGLLKPEVKEQIVGVAEIREVFRLPRAGVVAGSYVQSGLIRRNAPVRIIRNNVVVYDGIISSLRRFKDDVREVSSGYECGITIEGFNDIKEHDVLEVYETLEVARQLQPR
ncbi:MAG: translation initiation factor IF-2 [Candidatus Latescibacteria bacterium]|nr:translation initiation factor IF-2 [Candidatus Latescibacterota bacterium]